MSDKYDEAIKDCQDRIVAYSADSWDHPQRGHEHAIQLENVKISALREQQARENPKPLTLEQLRERDGKWVWVEADYVQFIEIGLVVTQEHYSGWGKVIQKNPLSVEVLPNNPGYFHENDATYYDYEPKEISMSEINAEKVISDLKAAAQLAETISSHRIPEALLTNAENLIQRQADRIKQLEAEKPDIVRCKDCSNWERHTETDLKRGGCYSAGKPLSNATTHEDHFCAYGKRKEV